MSSSVVSFWCRFFGHKWVQKPNHDWFVCKRCGEVKG